MQLYSSKFCEILFDETKSQLKQIWKSGTANMNSSDFVSEQTQLAEIFKQYKPKAIFSDARSAFFTIVPELQEWNAKEVLHHFPDNGGEKCGILLPKDLFSAISIEQALDEVKKEAFATKYFDNPEDLEAWLQS